MRRAKIVCTMGPAVLQGDGLEQLVAAGMDCARLNFSHGDSRQHLQTAERLRRAAAAAGRSISILADLQGPKIRVGTFPGGSVELPAGASFVLSGRPGENSAERATVSYEALAADLRPGHTVLLDDGLLALRVREVRGDDVICVVEVGGTLSDRKGVNLPGVPLSVPALTEKDRADLRFAIDEVRADYLALSFVRRAEDIIEAKALAKSTPVIAKLEKPEAVDHLEAIVDAADGIMVARGDLGVELGPEKVPMIQKRMIHAANRRGKLVITATQMLDSMIRNPRPTRAEAADVANAVLDGTDAVMLSGETATGRYPLDAVRMMDLLVREAETNQDEELSSRQLPEVSGEWEFTNAAARAAALLSFTLPLAGIVVLTRHGRSVELLSGYRPRAPIVAITPDAVAAQRLALRWGVRARTAPLVHEPEEARRLAARVLEEEGLVPGSGGTPGTNGAVAYALVAGWPPDGRTNTVTLQRWEPTPG
jgi:pyruvate kinase